MAASFFVPEEIALIEHQDSHWFRRVQHVNPPEPLIPTFVRPNGDVVPAAEEPFEFNHRNIVQRMMPKEMAALKKVDEITYKRSDGTTCICVLKNRDPVLENYGKTVLKVVCTERSSPEILNFEASVLSKVSFGQHPNIVQLIGSYDMHPYIGIHMEYCNRGDLETPTNVPRTSFQKMDLLRQVANGLHFMHSRNLVHMDIKPRNIAVHCEQGATFAKIIDFGSTRYMPSEVWAGSHITTTAYRPPEMFEGLPGANDDIVPLDGSYDIWSLGVVMFAIFNDRSQAPWSAAKPNIAAYKQYKDELLARGDHHTAEPYTSLMGSNLPGFVNTCLVHRMLAPDPSKRSTADGIARMMNCYQI